MDQKQLIDLVLSQMDSLPDRKVTRLTFGAHIAGVESAALGLATWACGKHPVTLEDLPALEGVLWVKELAQLLYNDDPLKSSIGLAALNSLLPDPPSEDLIDVNAGDLILELGRKKSVAVIGHFPFVERMKGCFDSLMVFEKTPLPGDLPADLIERRLPSADIVAITATTLSNGTLAGILSCCSKSAIKLIIGPSTPVSPMLFRLGFDYIAGVVVNDINMVRNGIEHGCSFKQIQGVRHVILSSGKFKKV